MNFALNERSNFRLSTVRIYLSDQAEQVSVVTGESLPLNQHWRPVESIVIAPVLAWEPIGLAVNTQLWVGSISVLDNSKLYVAEPDLEILLLPYTFVKFAP